MAVWNAPAWLAGRLHFGVLREGQGGQTAIGLGLSNPSPEMLDALEGARVSVFLEARSSSARSSGAGPSDTRQSPELIERIVAAGHELGLLARSSRGLAVARARLEALGNVAVSLVRMVRVHPFTLSRVRQAGVRVVWSGPTVRPGVVRLDTVRSGSPTPVADLLALAEPGGLLNLDGLTPPQVRKLIGTLRERGYQPGPIGKLAGLRTETLRGLLQRVYRRCIDVPFDRHHGTLALTQRPRGLFRISPRPYDGPPLPLPDGTQILPGVPAAELHIYSKRLVGLAELSALTGLRGVQTSLQDVAQALQERAEFGDVQLIYALTIFGGVLGTMGFQTEALPNRQQARVMAVFFNLLRVLYGAKNTDSQVLLPGIIWMTRETLLERYGKKR